MITIQIDTRQAQNMLIGLRRDIPKAANKGVYNLARYGAKVLKEEAQKAGIKKWGKGVSMFSKATRARKVRKGVFNIVMPKHGVMLDKGNYYIGLKRGRLINQWVKERFGTKVITGRSRVWRGPRGGVRGGFIYVTPKPFIQSAFQRIERKGKKIVSKEINKAIRRKGR